MAWRGKATMHASSSWREVSESSTTSCSVPTDSCETARPQPYAGVDTERRTRTRSPLRGSDDPAATRSISESTPFQCGWRGKSTTQRSPSNHTSVPTDRCETSPHSYRGVDTSGRTRSPTAGSASSGSARSADGASSASLAGWFFSLMRSPSVSSSDLRFASEPSSPASFRFASSRNCASSASCSLPPRRLNIDVSDGATSVNVKPAEQVARRGQSSKRSGQPRSSSFCQESGCDLEPRAQPSGDGPFARGGPSARRSARSGRSRRRRGGSRWSSSRRRRARARRSSRHAARDGRRPRVPGDGEAAARGGAAAADAGGARTGGARSTRSAFPTSSRSSRSAACRRRAATW